MSSNIAPPLLPPPVRSTVSAGNLPPRRGRRSSSHATLVAHGEPQLWLTGGALAISLVLIVGLLVLVVYQGIGTFWPKPIVELKLADGAVCLGEIARSERYKPEPQAFASLSSAIAAQAREDVARAGGFATRQLVRVGNFELTHAPFQWVDDFRIFEETRPEWALVLERLDNGRFYGRLEALLIDGKVVAATPEEAWQRFQVRCMPEKRRPLARTRGD